MDYYQILGLSKGASPDDIKKSYRKLAKKYHPDRNPDDKAAEARFKQIGEAYAVLSDDEKRQVYDTYGKDGFDGSGNPRAQNPFQDFGGFGFDSFSDIFGSVFGDHTRTHFGGRRNNNIQVEVMLTLQELIQGAKKNIALTRQTECTNCKGTGAEPGTRATTCPDCRGSGQVHMNRGFVSVTQTCPTCRGAGKIIKTPCAVCHGSGKKIDTETVSVDIPPGIKPGQTVQLKGAGHDGIGD